jgi:O-antigen ligase
MFLFVFSIPWEYSLDWGEPTGNIARVLGILLVLIAIPTVLGSGHFRPLGLMQWVTLALYLWFCCSCLWSIDRPATFDKLRGLAQELMIVWLVWEFVDRRADLQGLMRAFVAGSAVLAALSLANLGSIEAATASQARLVAAGQDPNDMARYLNLSLPIAAILLKTETRWNWRLLPQCFLPLGSVAVVLTASRSGLLAESVALVGCVMLLARSHTRLLRFGLLAFPGLALAMWFAVPRTIFERLGTIPEQIQSGDLNQRWNIWSTGWDAFVCAPILGSGAGTFVTAAGLASIDTAHNTALSILVSGGLCGLFAASAVVAVVIVSVKRVKGPLKLGLVITLLVLGLTSLVATVEESRTTWLILALIAVAGSFDEDGLSDSSRNTPANFPAVTAANVYMDTSSPE